MLSGMIRTETIIAVNDVKASANWYMALLGCSNTHPNGDVFDQLVDSDGTILLCLHRWGDHEHPTLRSADEGRAGNGLMLFFRVEAFDAVWERAQALGYQIDEEPHLNPFAGHREFALRDLDGYDVTICSVPD